MFSTPSRREGNAHISDDWRQPITASRLPQLYSSNLGGSIPRHVLAMQHPVNAAFEGMDFRYLGSDANQAAQVCTAVANLQRPVQLARNAAHLLAEVRQQMRQMKDSLEPHFVERG